MILAVIPARYASTRFPGKPLVEIQGKTMIQRVWEQVIQSQRVDVAVIATDDDRIAAHVEAFGGLVVRTRADHPSGTDRCAEVAGLFPAADFILNIQGDEPFVQPQQIDLLANTLCSDPAFSIATLAKRLEDAEALFNPNVVKAAFAENGRAIYFSRHPIPFLRGQLLADWVSVHPYFKHIGLYGFRRETLLHIAGLAPTPLERAESLEQLRWLEHGLPIRVGQTDWETIGIDTPEDLLKISA